MTSVEPGDRQNTQPRPGEAEAVEAAARHADSSKCGWLIDSGHIDERDVAEIVAAAYPVIAAAVLAEAEKRVGKAATSFNNEADEYGAGWANGAASALRHSLSAVAALRSELSGESSLGAGQ